ncbi:hypothetical protein L484_011958 [Morus notabilis]|uniref:Uncharacterized protein n=1 Tax=Morus notabilis TaxID=981085 RepID=W9S2B0_9ROSA|nr:hypothetical protein L484_011958 [Morus notabilis]
MDKIGPKRVKRYNQLALSPIPDFPLSLPLANLTGKTVGLTVGVIEAEHQHSSAGSNTHVETSRDMVSDHQTDVDSLRNDTSPEYGGGGGGVRRRRLPESFSATDLGPTPHNLTLLSPLVWSISHHSACNSTYRDRQRR